MRISENTKLGLKKARRKGKRSRRPPVEEKEKILETYGELKSLRATAKKLKRPYSTVKKVVDGVSR